MHKFPQSSPRRTCSASMPKMDRQRWWNFSCFPVGLELWRCVAASCSSRTSSTEPCSLPPRLGHHGNPSCSWMTHTDRDINGHSQSPSGTDLTFFATPLAVVFQGSNLSLVATLVLLFHAGCTSPVILSLFDLSRPRFLLRYFPYFSSRIASFFCNDLDHYSGCPRWNVVGVPVCRHMQNLPKSIEIPIFIRNSIPYFRLSMPMQHFDDKQTLNWLW